MKGSIATAEIDVDGPAADVRRGLTDPDLVAQYGFHARVDSDWRPGSPIVWRGEYEGTSFEDKGEVVEADPPRRLVVTHFSPMTGLPDEPENYHTLAYDITDRPGGTHVRLQQDNNADDAEADRNAKNWQMLLAGLKETVEG